jgi:protein-S-isoprenylcysteine O-methyltransferase Ste14
MNGTKILIMAVLVGWLFSTGYLIASVIVCFFVAMVAIFNEERKLNRKY